MDAHIWIHDYVCSYYNCLTWECLTVSMQIQNKEKNDLYGWYNDHLKNCFCLKVLLIFKVQRIDKWVLLWKLASLMGEWMLFMIVWYEMSKPNIIKSNMWKYVCFWDRINVEECHFFDQWI